MSIGLMAASSGIDGAYMAAWMPDGAGWLGYVLNTTSDVASEVLMFWFGRLQQERKGSKKWRLSRWILAAESVIVTFSWFFGWRQLRLVMPRIEGNAAHWVAPVSAAFVPVLLVSTGYAQALREGRFEKRESASAERAQSENVPTHRTAVPAQSEAHNAAVPGKSAAEGPQSEADAPTYEAHCGHCDWYGKGYETERAAENALRAHMRWCSGKESNQ
jgi:hypothetical protein